MIEKSKRIRDELMPTITIDEPKIEAFEHLAF